MNRLFWRSVESFGKNVFLYDHRAHTYRDIAHRVNMETMKWRRSGVQHGDRVILGHGNSVDFVVKLLSAWDIGAVVAPLHPGIPIEKYHLDIIRPYMIDRERHDQNFFFPENRSMNEHDLAVIMFTSGTSSGNAKAVPLTHENILLGMESIGQVFPHDKINETDRSHAFLPWYHIYGLICELLFMMSRGGRCTIRRKDESMISFLQRIKYENPTLLFCIPKYLEKVHSYTQKYAWCTSYKLLRRVFFGKNMRMISSGGAVLVPEVYTTVHDRMKINLYQGYGMTECAPMVCLEDEPMNTIGRLLPHMEMRMDPLTGIAEVRGKSLFPGYLTSSSQEFIRPKDKFTEDGWFITGDRVALERNGLYRYVQRDGTMFKLNNGKFVDPVEMEKVLMRSGYFDSVVVIANRNHSHTVVVGRTDGRDVVIQQIRDYLRDKVDYYALPNQWIEMKEEPTVENGLLTIKMEPNRMKIRAWILNT